MASTSGLSFTTARPFADAVPATIAAFCLFQPFGPEPVHLAEPRKRAHEDEKKNDDFSNHGSEAKARIGCTFLDTLHRITDNLRAKPGQQSPLCTIATELGLFAETVLHHR